MSHSDDITHDGWTPKYLPGFKDTVDRLGKVDGPRWTLSPYTDQAALEQLLQQAWWAGRMAGVTWVLGHPDAPGPVGIEPDAPRETREQVEERLGLFPPASRPPQPLSGFLAAHRAEMEGLVPSPVGDTRTWMVRQARIALGTDLADAMNLVRSVTE